MSDAADRLRRIRAAGYRCQYRDQRGVLCAAPAKELDELGRVVCDEHH